MKKFVLIFLSFLVLASIIGIFMAYWHYQSTPQYYVDTFNTYLKAASEDKTPDAKNKIDKALEAITAGIKKYPNRLDMRIGKIYVCDTIQHIPCVEREILETVEQSTQNNNLWEWLDGGKRDKPFMLEQIQVYQYHLWNAQKDNEIVRIAEAILKQYPNHFESLNSLGTVYSLRGHFDKAQEYFLKAQALSPNDKIVKQNLEELQKMKAEKAVQKNK